MTVKMRLGSALLALIVTSTLVTTWAARDENSSDPWGAGTNSRNQREKRIRLVVERSPKTEGPLPVKYRINGEEPRSSWLREIHWERIIQLGPGRSITLTAGQPDAAHLGCRIEDAQTGQVLDRETRDQRGAVNCRYAR